jgi:ABC-type spermidine/putrescine transport system permease subunit II
MLFFDPLRLILAQSFSDTARTPSLATYTDALGGPRFATALLHTIEIAACARLPAA